MLRLGLGMLQLTIQAVYGHMMGTVAIAPVPSGPGKNRAKRAATAMIDAAPVIA